MKILVQELLARKKYHGTAFSHNLNSDYWKAWRGHFLWEALERSQFFEIFLGVGAESWSPPNWDQAFDQWYSEHFFQQLVKLVTVIDQALLRPVLASFQSSELSEQDKWNRLNYWMRQLQLERKPLQALIKFHIQQGSSLQLGDTDLGAEQFCPRSPTTPWPDPVDSLTAIFHGLKLQEAPSEL